MAIWTFEQKHDFWKRPFNLSTQNLLCIEYDYDYDYEMVLLRHTISTMYHGIIFKSCKKHNILQ